MPPRHSVTGIVAGPTEAESSERGRRHFKGEEMVSVSEWGGGREQRRRYGWGSKKKKRSLQKNVYFFLVKFTFDFKGWTIKKIHTTCSEEEAKQWRR